jgi:hypothetical protein
MHKIYAVLACGCKVPLEEFFKRHFHSSNDFQNSDSNGQPDGYPLMYCDNCGFSYNVTDIKVESINA